VGFECKYLAPQGQGPVEPDVSSSLLLLSLLVLVRLPASGSTALCPGRHTLSVFEGRSWSLFGCPPVALIRMIRVSLPYLPNRNFQVQQLFVSTTRAKTPPCAHGRYIDDDTPSSNSEDT